MNSLNFGGAAHLYSFVSSYISITDIFLVLTILYNNYILKFKLKKNNFFALS